MLTDLVVNILGPILAKRFSVIRKAVWAILIVFLAFFIYGALAF